MNTLANIKLPTQIPGGTLRDWLLDPGSLTANLRRSCAHQAGTFSVEVLRQSWQRPTADERRALRLRPRSVCLIREVALCCDGEAWVYARTTIPTRTLRGPNRRLADLGDRPLGEFLFRTPGIRRSPLQVMSLAPGDRLYERATATLGTKPARIWGRRSVFLPRGKPLLVAEFFHADLPALVPGRP